jgi:peptide/nickel transport system permease protein
MGRSIFESESVARLIFGRLGATLELALTAMLVALVLGIGLGVVATVWRGRAADVLAMLVALTDAVIALFALDPAPLGQALAHILLPAFALGIGAAAIISRVVRASLLETLHADFVRTGHAKGLHPARVVLIHALRNAMLPVISVIGLRFGALLGGAVLTETIFNWPGLGQLAVTAILQRDIPLVQGVVLVFALLYALTNLAVDLLYTAIDPRVRLG